MIEDMTIRNMSPSTQKIYVAAVANFSIFHGRSPDKLTFEHVPDYRLHLISRGLKPNSINPIMGALRFFYRKQGAKADFRPPSRFLCLPFTLPQYCSLRPA
ncbi:MAG: integrase/recombinase XerD [Methylobacteriaceae bacterium]|jgi:hypothetical protein|nr:integrase/recombinase XerD [Methylobacteriaceae bacterium]